MSNRIRVKFQDGVFIPLEPLPANLDGQEFVVQIAPQDLPKRAMIVQLETHDADAITIDVEPLLPAQAEEKRITIFKRTGSDA